MSSIVVKDLALRGELEISIDAVARRFKLRSDLVSAAALRELEPVDQDFLEIAAAVFLADSELGRGGTTRPGMGIAWYRDLSFNIPVRDHELWSRVDVTGALVELVQFLTGDHVTFRFIPRRHLAPHAAFLDLDPNCSSFPAEEVILFSGGLDSLAGALECLSTTPGKVVLVSHCSAPKVTHRQTMLAGWLKSKFENRLCHVKVPATRIGAESKETTQRSRSLLFAAIGHAVARSFGARKLSFYENGIVSHNLPIGPQVVGTMATHTTHPGTIALLNRLIRLIAPAATEISNPYCRMTKTEVVERIARHGGKTSIGWAVSCTHVRDQSTIQTHCGRCSQCLDRRFAILAAGLQGYDPDCSYATDILLGTQGKDRGRTLAVDWVRHAIRLGQMSETDFIQAFGQDVARSLRSEPASTRDEHYRQILEMHRRHGQYVSKVLEAAISDHSADLINSRLDPTCLLRLLIGHQTQLGVGQEMEPVKLPDTGEFEGPEIDTPVSPDGPWTARFFIENDYHVVAIDHLGRIRGDTAWVAHLLKDVRVADEAKDLSPADIQFVHIHTLPGWNKTKDVAKQNVARARRYFAAAYKDVFDLKPPRHLLIESSGKRGHRIDRMTRVIDKR